MAINQNTVNTVIKWGMALLLAIIGGAIMISLIGKQFPGAKMILTALGGQVQGFVGSGKVNVGVR
ncbi:MAG: hypothetical protein GOU98_02020 [Candidatus Altiarchaeota archaeon]|nr:hypothetical protein [Candidatus Altiarchaeota archaeon]